MILRTTASLFLFTLAGNLSMAAGQNEKDMFVSKHQTTDDLRGSSGTSGTVTGSGTTTTTTTSGSLRSDSLLESDAEEGQAHQYLRKKNLMEFAKGIIPHNHNNNPTTTTTSTKLTSDGINFSRSVDMEADDLHIVVGFDDGHCQESDEWGDNECHYDWGETLDATFDVDLDQSPFQEGDFLHASLTVDLFMNWEFDCPVCGGDCTITIPIIEEDIIIPMPPCPLTNDDVPPSLQIFLGDSSPLAGVPMHVEGIVFLQKANDGPVVAKSHVNLNLR